MAQNGEINLQGEEWKMSKEKAWAELQRFITDFRGKEDYQADMLALLLLDFIGEVACRSNEHYRKFKEISNLAMFTYMDEALTVCSDNVRWIQSNLRKGMD